MTFMTKPGFRRSRSLLEGEVRIRSVHGHWSLPLQDLSMSGANIALPPGFDLPIGHPLEFELHCGPAEARVRLVLRARIARRDADRVGLRFERLSPLLERELRAVLDAHGTLRDDLDRDPAGG